jgi:cytochrome c-type biogenesis protein
MSPENITFSLAFVAGFLSFTSPCVLPLVPVYLGYLTGSAIGSDESPSRAVIFLHALFFVSGFTVIFVVIFGAPFGLLGTFLRGTFSSILVKVGGIFLIFFGLHLGGFFRFLGNKFGGSFETFSYKLDMLILPERRMQAGQEQSPSFIRSFFVGMTFAAGWTPCIGPLLGAILTLGASGQSFGYTIALLFVYSMGLAVPFLLTALLLTTATGFLRKLNKHAHIIELVSAAFLIIIGFLLITDQFTALFNSTFSSMVPRWLMEKL